MQLAATSPNTDLVADMRQFIIDLAEGRKADTVAHYVQVADDLAVFMELVDVRPWLGRELADHLAAEREQRESDAFLPSLGLSSFIRVFPAFVKSPWLPPVGVQRRTHRTVARRLMTFLRLRALQDGCLRKDDFIVIGNAIGYAGSEMYAHVPAPREGIVTCTVTLDLVEHLVDRMLEEVTDGRHESLDEAIAARLNPVQVTVWQDPEYDAYGDHRRGW